MKSIEELRAANAAATPGEWEHKEGLVFGADRDDGEESARLVCDVVGDPTWAVNEEDSHNANFIVLAHNEFPAMLDEIETLRNEVNQRANYYDFLDTRNDELGVEVEQLQAEVEAQRERANSLMDTEAKLRQEVAQLRELVKASRRYIKSTFPTA